MAEKNDSFSIKGCVCVFLASGYEWVTVMHEIPISSAQTMTSLPYYQMKEKGLIYIYLDLNPT
jgi:hypothetical protein